MSSDDVAPGKTLSAALFQKAAVLIGACGLGYALTTAVPMERRPWYLDTLLYSVILIATALLALARPILVQDQRNGWACVGLAITMWAGGDILWQALYGGAASADIPVPGPSDPFYLAMYPLAYAGLILLARAEVRTLPASVLLDGIVTSLAAGAVFAAISLNTVLSSTEGKPWIQTMVNLAYPIGDLVLMVVSVGVLSMVRWRPDPVWWLLGLGAAFFAIADTAWLFSVANETYKDGNWMDGVWMLGLSFLAVAGSSRRRHEAAEVQGFAALLVPIIFSLCALTVLVAGTVFRLHPVSIVLASGCVVAAGVRTALTFEQTRELARTRQKAETDELSGIGNRRMLDARLPAMISDLQPGSLLTLTIVSVDHVSEINGVLGYSAGDTILNTVGARLLEKLPDRAVSARLGGVEVAVLQFVRHAEAGYLERDTRALLADLAAPVPTGQIPVHIEMSAGVAVAPVHAATPTDLIRCAADALRSAKTNRSEVEIYDPAGDVGHQFGATLFPDLVRAIDNEELVTEYQPKVELVTGRPVALEGILIWKHPNRGSLRGETLHPLAARVGLTRRLTRALLESALVNCLAWRRLGVSLGVAVDITPADLLDVRLPYDLARMINKWGLPPSALTLEIAEEVLLIDPRRTGTALGQFRDFGIRLALDHYGKSAPSLTRLRALQVDELKLDRSFVAPILASAQDAAVVRSTVDLAKSLGIGTYVEGVDSQELLEAVTACGCAGVQGSAVGDPMSAETVRRWLAPAAN